MSAKFMILVLCILTISVKLCSQEVLEVNQIESGTEFWELYDEVVPIIETDTNAAIKLYEDAFHNTKNNFTKSSIIHQLGTLYSTPKQFDKCLSMCEELVKSGVSVFFTLRDKTYPSFTKEFENIDRYPSILEQNNELVKKMNEITKAEYYIQKPNNFNENKKYPLFMIFHGGIGSIQNLQHYWRSAFLNENYIVVYVQGGNFICSIKRRFGPEGKTDIKEIFKKIREDYLIDTSKVILAGQSAGGMLSIDLAINNHISAQGLVLAFPVKPREFGADEIYSSGLKGLRISMICGENDWALERQKEMSVIFDKLDVPNRIVIYPDNGHEFPDDFSSQIVKSVNFIDQK
ncbi:MAG: hypothetical protein DWP97_07055 [Calditrichaeota bacterium]|nr:MAG: hypothetical protein DWP97_07055 [Calditrichota bacterium]